MWDRDWDMGNIGARIWLIHYCYRWIIYLPFLTWRRGEWPNDSMQVDSPRIQWQKSIRTIVWHAKWFWPTSLFYNVNNWLCTSIWKVRIITESLFWKSTAFDVDIPLLQISNAHPILNKYHCSQYQWKPLWKHLDSNVSKIYLLK